MKGQRRRRFRGLGEASGAAAGGGNDVTNSPRLPSPVDRSIDGMVQAAFAHPDDVEVLDTWQLRREPAAPRGAQGRGEAAIGEKEQKRQAAAEKKNRKQHGPLANGWKSAVDPSTQRRYYYHRASGKVSWDKPGEELPLPDDGYIEIEYREASHNSAARNSEKEETLENYVGGRWMAELGAGLASAGSDLGARMKSAKSNAVAGAKRSPAAAADSARRLFDGARNNVGNGAVAMALKRALASRKEGLFGEDDEKRVPLTRPPRRPVNSDDGVSPSKFPPLGPDRARADDRRVIFYEDPAVREGPAPDDSSPRMARSIVGAKRSSGLRLSAAASARAVLCSSPLLKLMSARDCLACGISSPRMEDGSGPSHCLPNQAAGEPCKAANDDDDVFRRTRGADGDTDDPYVDDDRERELSVIDASKDLPNMSNVELELIEINDEGNQALERNSSECGGSDKQGGCLKRSFSWKPQRPAQAPARTKDDGCAKMVDVMSKPSPRAVDDLVGRRAFAFEQERMIMTSGSACQEQPQQQQPAKECEWCRQSSSVEEEQIEVRLHNLEGQSGGNDTAEQHRRLHRGGSHCSRPMEALGLGLSTLRDPTGRNLSQSEAQGIEGSVQQLSPKGSDANRRRVAPFFIPKMVASTIMRVSSVLLGDRLTRADSCGRIVTNGDMEERGGSISYPDNPDGSADYTPVVSNPGAPRQGGKKLTWGAIKQRKERLTVSSSSFLSSGRKLHRDASSKSPTGVDELIAEMTAFQDGHASAPFCPPPSVPDGHEEEGADRGELLNVSKVVFEGVEEEDVNQSGCPEVIERSGGGATSETAHLIVDLEGLVDADAAYTCDYLPRSDSIDGTREHRSSQLTTGTSACSFGKATNKSSAIDSSFDDDTLRTRSSSVGKCLDSLFDNKSLKMSTRMSADTTMSTAKARGEFPCPLAPPPMYEAYEVTYRQRKGPAPAAKQLSHRCKISKISQHTSKTIQHPNAWDGQQLSSFPNMKPDDDLVSQMVISDDDQRFAPWGSQSVVSALFAPPNLHGTDESLSPCPVTSPPTRLSPASSMSTFKDNDSLSTKHSTYSPPRGFSNAKIIVDRIRKLNVKAGADASDVNSMSAIYSQDEEKMLDRKGVAEILGDLHDSSMVAANDDESGLTVETEMDIHYLSRLDTPLGSGENGKLFSALLGIRENEEEIICGNRPDKFKSNTRDCNYGSLLENEYEDFGIERQLIPSDEEEKMRQKIKDRKPAFIKMLNKASMAGRTKLSPFSNPVDLDELSMSVASLRSNVSKNSFRAIGGEGRDRGDDSMIELVRFEDLKWLVDCGSDWVCDEDAHTSCLAKNDLNVSQETDVVQELEVACKAIAGWDGDIDKIPFDKLDFDKIIDVMDYIINGRVCGDYDCDMDYYDCRTECDDGKTVDLEINGDESATQNSSKEDGNGGGDSQRIPVLQPRGPRKVALASTDAIRMQRVVFVAPNIDNQTSPVGFLQS